MHTYSINQSERITVLGVIGILSLLIIFGIHKYLPSGFPAPSVLALFSGIVFVFDKWIWKWKIFQKTCIKTPNLNGQWTMITKSSLKGAEEYEAVLTIKQTWTHIFLFMDGEKTTGSSLMAGIEIKTDDLFYLKWEYLSEYKPEFAEGQVMHYGMTKVIMKPLSDPNSMRGNYYADQTRHTFGPVNLIKKT
ncbi:hypothetical protein A4D02_34705 [Niastella koreensis]|uniref:CD-NTase-associated protein 15 domain-containing protein n=2 Tax=Niastella koreensis TaxID=354356 RepID=G8T7H3_NIAKG|nr:hypothetical protein [Niastella koreensis]AEW02228.1 hypothetical protein Niako_6002 [Niastella koreensis GR20-10]OQP45103.1 hypothetical protein A4D02_34705 [Niastella koreensis]